MATKDGSRGAARWIAGLALVSCALLVASVGAAQTGSNARPDAGPGECTPSPEPHECADRCPNYDTCFINTGDGQLYYRVDEQRFDCDDLDCGGATQRLGDYCCQRGEFAPAKGDGDSCTLALPGSHDATSAASVIGLLGALATLRARRRRQPK